MAYPPIYEVGYSYLGFQQAQGDNSFPGTQIDNDFAGLSDSLAALSTFTKSVIRSDGALNNGVVTYDSLSSELSLGVAPTWPWATGTAYIKGSSVIANNGLYRALVAHTSGVFATDLAAGKWVFLVTFQPGDTDLTAIAALTGAGIPTRVSDGVWSIHGGDDNHLPKWSSNGLTQQSQFYDSGTDIGISTRTPAAGFDVLKSTMRVGDGSTSSLTLAGGSGVGKGAVLEFDGQGASHYIGTASRILGGTSAALVDFVAGANDRVFDLNNIERMRISGLTGFIGVGTDTPAYLMDMRQLSSAIPWTTLHTIWDTNRTVIGNYPIAEQYGTNTVGTVEALVGLVDIPAVTNSLLLNGWGVAGYARTASPQTAAVGIFGYGGITATGAFGAWGGNVIATNSRSHMSGTNSGFDALSMYGFEVNPMLWKTAAGGAPNIPLRGFYVIGGSEVQTTNLANGIEIDAHGVFAVPKIPWKKAITTVDASALVAFDIGALGVGNSVASQPIQFNGRDAGGVLRTTSIAASLSGDMIYNTPATGQHLFAYTGVNMAGVDGLGLRALVATQSTSTTTGALTSAGGLGVVKDAYIGGAANISGTMNAGAIKQNGVAIRETLAAARTYYVRSDGSDANTGLANTAGGAFLTIQKAYDTIVAKLDLAGQAVTIQIGDATWTAGLAVSSPWTGGGSVTIQGNSSTPANVLLSTTSVSAIGITTPLPGVLTIKDMKLQTTTGGSGIANTGKGVVQFSNIVFGACATYGLTAAGAGAALLCTGNCSVTGGATFFAAALNGGLIDFTSRTVTLTGTPAFTVFAYSEGVAGIYAPAATFSGAATGQRYSVNMNATINTGGGGASFFPGSTAGGTATGGQYG